MFGAKKSSHGLSQFPRHGAIVELRHQPRQGHLFLQLSEALVDDVQQLSATPGMAGWLLYFWNGREWGKWIMGKSQGKWQDEVRVGWFMTSL